MRADNRLSKSLEEAFINNDTQYNFGGWAPQKLFPRNFWVAGSLHIPNLPITYPNVLSYSPDGINWYGGQGSNEKIFAVYDITWSGEKWVAVGQRGNVAQGSRPNTIVYSTDGVNWESSYNSLSVFSSSTLSVYWNGEMFVAGGGRPARLAYSYDGIVWSGATTLGSFSAVNCNDVIFNGTYWGAVGATNGVVGFSTDGKNWNAPVLVIPISQGYSISYGDGLWVVGGYENIFYSSDMVNWSGSNASSIGISFENIEYNGSMFVAGATDIITGGQLLYSYDGITWSGSSSGNTLFDAVEKVAWNGKIWIAAGTSNNYQTLASSVDGINWTPIPGTTSVVGFEGYSIAAQPAPNLYPPRY